MRRLGIVAMLFLAACVDNSIPKDIIAKEKMEQIVWELTVADDFVTVYIAKDTTNDVNAERMKRYQQIFDLHKITRAEFKKSYNYYMGHPDVSKPMFDSIAARATRERYKPREGADTARSVGDSARLNPDDSIPKPTLTIDTPSRRTDTVRKRNRALFMRPLRDTVGRKR